MGVSFSGGFVLGPAFNFFFKSVDFWLGSWHFTYANIPGMYMAVIFTLVEIMCVFMIYDLSKEYDLKSVESGKAKQVVRRAISTDASHVHSSFASLTISMNEERVPLLVEHQKIPSVLNVFKSLIFNVDTALLLVTSFFSSYFIVSFDMWLPLLVIETMHWTIVEMNAIVLASAIACGAACLLLIWKPLSNRLMFFMALFSILGLASLQTVFITLSVFHGNLCL